MPRAARVVIPGCPHHLTQRGNNRQPVFYVDDDRRVYLKLLREQSERFELAVVGHCLMTNHIHMVATPSSADSLAKGIGSTHLKYSRYINRLHGRCGHLWQDRFFSSPLDEEYFWRAVRYVERKCDPGAAGAEAVAVRLEQCRGPRDRPRPEGAAGPGGLARGVGS